MMVATNRDVTNSVGGAEIILNVAIDQGGTLVASSMEILTISPTVARDFRCGSAHTMDNVLTISVYKKKTKVPLYIELDYITSLGNAFEVLDSITTNIDLGSVADTNPPQQSIFTHVGNSKGTLAASITGKGVQTSADATFVQMAANIDAIPAKLMMTGTKLSPSNTYSFKFAKVTGTLYQPYISIEDIPFAPKIIRVFSMTLTGNVEEYSSLYIAEDEGLGVNLSRHVTGYFGGATATGQDSYLMIASVTSLNGKWAVIMPVPLVSRYYKYTIVG
ncbi:hypothetical protein ACVNNN_13570 [Lysinibacillus fusiformis]|uniref:hypothetical protein n=1 Tax=Lysinibacillus sp. PWR01 TaxID=3342384 RepID=UPI00372D806A